MRRAGASYVHGDVSLDVGAPRPASGISSSEPPAYVEVSNRNAAEQSETTISRLRAKQYDCVIIGAGIRSNPKSFLLFERLVNVVHALAPKARIGFNTKPTDPVDPVQRCL